MKPLDPAEYAALQFAAGWHGEWDSTPVGDTDWALVSSGLMTIRDFDATTYAIDATESGHRALRVHAAYLATVGGGS